MGNHCHASYLEKPKDEPPTIVPFQGEIYSEVEKTGLFVKGEETAQEAEYSTVGGGDTEKVYTLSEQIIRAH